MMDPGNKIPANNLPSDQITQLQERITQLEAVELAYQQLQELVEYAATNQSLEQFAGSIILYVDQESQQIIEANQQAENYLGYTAKELCTFTIADFETDGDKAPPRNAITFFEGNHAIDIYETMLKHKQGNLLHTRIEKRVIQRDGTDIFHYTLEDLSLRKKLWHELYRREDTSYEFLESLKVLNEINSVLGDIASFDELCKACIELGIQRLGFDRLSLWFFDTKHKTAIGAYGVDEEGFVRDERDVTWAYDNTFLELFTDGNTQPRIIQDNARIYNSDSDLIAYGWHVAVPVLSGGEVVGFMTADNFINRLPLKNFQPELLRLYGATLGHLAARLNEHEMVRKLSNAVQHSASMILILDDNATVEFANNAYCTISGHTAEAILGQHLDTLMDSESFQRIWQAITNGVEWRGELSHKTKDGDRYDTIVSLTPIQINDKMKNYVMVQEDVTALKDAQQHAIAHQMEQERTQVLESFISAIGHEFRTPLTIINTSNYLMATLYDDARHTSYSNQIKAQVHYLSQMVDDMLDVVMLNNALPLKRTTVDLHDLVQQTVDRMKPLASEKTIQWILNLEHAQPVHADAGNLSRVLTEIIKNAIQFIDSKGTIIIELCGDEDMAIIRIIDNGIGITSQEIESIFNRFYRGDKARSTRGAGLGLSIAKLIMDAHHGTIDVSSNIGKGSMFTITLPR